MRRVTLGRTGLNVNANGFGALPVQRVSVSEAVYILQKAFYNGVDFFDTARFYTDSEVKLGAAFEYIRDRITIATKTGAQNGNNSHFLTGQHITLRLADGSFDPHLLGGKIACCFIADQHGDLADGLSELLCTCILIAQDGHLVANQRMIENVCHDFTYSR